MAFTSYRLALKLAAILLSASPLLLVAQQAPPASSAQAPQEHIYQPGNLAERPRSIFMPAPSYPTSALKNTQFTVEYVYRYAESHYTPAVPIQNLTRAKAQLDTPEHTFESLISATRSLDYEWFLSLWDAKSQALFREQATTKKQDANFWRERWRASMQGKTVFLQKRLELVNYVILEYSAGAGSAPTQTLQPVVLKLVDGKWLLTQELAESSVLFFVGQGQASAAGPADFYPIPQYSGQPAPLEGQQELFFAQEPKGMTTASRIVW